MATYCVKEPMMALDLDREGHFKVLTLGAGAVLRVIGADERMPWQGLVEVESAGGFRGVFLRDLRMRGELLTQPAQPVFKTTFACNKEERT